MVNIVIVSKFFRSPQKLAFDNPKTVVGAAAILLAVATLIFLAGFATRGVNGAARGQIAEMKAQLAKQKQELALAREDAQREINAVAARVGELQAQANRLNALGERLTRDGKLSDGEFNFNRTPGVGGAENVSDVPAGDLLHDLDTLQARFEYYGSQLSLLESLMYDQQMQLSSTPSRMPAAGYITSGFGGRSDPFSGGRAHHLGIDINANTGDPVRATADGVVSFSGIKNGYGNVVEIDHGNGVSTLYAHNSRLLVRAGDLVRAGQEVSKAGSTGRSTGPHVHFEVHVNGQPVNPIQFLSRAQG